MVYPLFFLALLLAAQSPSIPESQRPAFELLGVERAWQVTRGAGVRVGVVDVGFDLFHPALKPALAPGYFASGVFHSPANPVIAHGTAVASVIGARLDVDAGLIGLAPECQMIAASRGMPEHTLARLQRELNLTRQAPEKMAELLRPHLGEVRAFQQEWLRYIARTTAEAIEYLVAQDVHVINISEYLPLDAFAGVPDLAERIQAAFAAAARRDIVIVLGAGNNDTRVERYPGDARFVIVAGAVTAADERWRPTTGDQSAPRQGSSYGPRLTVMAPMEQLRVARPHEPAFYQMAHTPLGPIHDGFGGLSETVPVGATSLAAAVVTGLVVLVRSADPALHAAEVVDVVTRGAKDLDLPGRDDQTGFGRIDFSKTLSLVANKRSTQ